jgi:hypothetical protein
MTTQIKLAYTGVHLVFIASVSRTACPHQNIAGLLGYRDIGSA